MRVAGVNMTESNSQCPTGLQLITSPKRLCRKSVTSGCSSATFSVHGVPYRRVCGKVIGYQYFDTDGFKTFYANQQLTIDGVYMDEVSITHGRSPRHHIWTLAAARDEVPTNTIESCPCTNSKSYVPFTGLIHHLWALTTFVKLPVVLLPRTSTIFKTPCGMGRVLVGSHPAVMVVGSHGSARNCPQT